MSAIRRWWCLSSCVLAIALHAATAREPEAAYPPAAEVRATLLKQLDRPRVALDPQTSTTANLDGGLIEERLTIATERKADGSLERMPILIVRPSTSDQRRPCAIFLHGTGQNKDKVRRWLVDVAERGMIGVAIDARYHGDRSVGATGSTAYVAAITRAWRARPGEPQEHPFYFDTAWDLWRLLDYLGERSDVDPRRIAMVGFSMGGIQTWLAAAVDERVAVAVPCISVQSFRWSLDNERWQARAGTIAGAHQAAAADLGETAVNAGVCRALWNKVIPGMLDQFDCPSMLRLFAGRPLLIVSGELDPNCPLPGAQLAIASAEKAYADAGCSDRLRVDIAAGVAHQVAKSQEPVILAWLERWLEVPVEP